MSSFSSLCYCHFFVLNLFSNIASFGRQLRQKFAGLEHHVRVHSIEPPCLNCFLIQKETINISAEYTYINAEF